ncbi:hypothetical protein D7V83_10860 [bacterium 0.1xD8-71]|nr:hypothetical protein D7V83_10860 [bacterium 0.1xD8-71]
MKDVFIIYNTCCFYEIVILNYFMSCTDCDVLLCSPDGNPIRTTEGYCVNADMALAGVKPEQIRSFIIPGGDISYINEASMHLFLQDLKQRNVLIAAICAGVNLLDDAGILRGIQSTHNMDLDIANDQHVITARANAYVDFAIETAKELDLFTDEEDLQETIAFWKYFKRA